MDFSFSLYYFVQDTMMDCGGDSGEDNGGLKDFVDLATDITDNSRTIRGNLFIVYFLSCLCVFTSKYYLCVTNFHA